MKKKFLDTLARLLAPLEAEEKNEILRFYEERFETSILYEGKTEQEVVDELESPMDIARNVLEAYGHKATPQNVSVSQASSSVSFWQIAWLLVFDFFTVTALIPLFFGLFFGLAVGWVGFVIGFVNVAGIFAVLFYIGISFLWLLFLVWLYDVVVGFVAWLLRWHFNVFNVKQGHKIVKRLRKIRFTYVVKKRVSLARLKSTLTFLAVIGLFVGGIGSFVTGVVPSLGRELEEQREVFNVSNDITDEQTWGIISDMDYGYVRIVSSSNDDIRVISSEHEDYPVTIDIDHESRVITVSNNVTRPNMTMIFIWEWLLERPGVTIEVPEALLVEDLQLEGRNSAITIENMTFNSLDVTTSNGAITLRDLVISGSIDLDTSNGRIEVYRVEGAVLNARTSNGRIVIENTKIDTMDVKTSNGRIEMENLYSASNAGISLNAVTSNGDIKFNNVYFNRVDAHTSNGDIDYINSDTSYRPQRLRLSTSNGDKTVNVIEN